LERARKSIPKQIEMPSTALHAEHVHIGSDENFESSQRSPRWPTTFRNRAIGSGQKLRQISRQNKHEPGQTYDPNRLAKVARLTILASRVF